MNTPTAHSLDGGLGECAKRRPLLHGRKRANMELWLFRAGRVARAGTVVRGPLRLSQSSSDTENAAREDHDYPADAL